jgi:hypothetical protein
MEQRRVADGGVAIAARDRGEVVEVEFIGASGSHDTRISQT